MFFTGSLNRPFPSIRLPLQGFPASVFLPASLPSLPNHSHYPLYWAHPRTMPATCPFMYAGRTRIPSLVSRSPTLSLISFHICVCACLYVCLYICVLVCMCVRLCLCMFLCMYTLIRTPYCLPFRFNALHVLSSICVCMCVYWSVSVCVCLSVCICFLFLCVYRMLLVLYTLHSPVSLLSAPYSTFSHLASFIFRVSRYTHSHTHDIYVYVLLFVYMYHMHICICLFVWQWSCSFATPTFVGKNQLKFNARTAVRTLCDSIVVSATPTVPWRINGTAVK